MSEKLEDWRAFEKLVARIEKDLVEAQAQVTSPDRLKCSITGRLREVDACVCFSENGSERLIVLECRKRSKVQDVTWIEQLATKKKSLGIEQLIAVSASGFSKEARSVAEYYQIELRDVRKLSADELINPVVDMVQFWFRRCVLEKVGILRFRDQYTHYPTSIDDVDFFLPCILSPDEPIFLNTEEGHKFSVNDLLHKLEKATNPFEGVQKYAPPTTHVAAFPFPGNVRLSMSSEEVNVGWALMQMRLWLQSEDVTLEDARRFSYGGPSNFVERIEFTSRENTHVRWLHVQQQKDKDGKQVHRFSGDWPRNEPE